MAYRISEMQEDVGGSRAARLLSMIRRDIQGKTALMRERRRNEEVLALKYLDGGTVGSADETKNLCQYALNLPYRYARWMESQATSKKIVVKVGRDAGAGQLPGGVSDTETGMWQGIALTRIAYEAGFKREMASVIREVLPRGTSVMKIGYHKQEITSEEERQVGKDAQSVVADVLGQGDVEAKPEQAHAEIAQGLEHIVTDPMAQLVVGLDGAMALVDRKESHEKQEMAEAAQDIPRQDTRLTRHRLWMRKLRVGEDVGWTPWVSVVTDASEWWERIVWTVAEVKASPLISDEFKKVVKGYDARNTSTLSGTGTTESTRSMGSDARLAQSEDVLEDDERMVELYFVWCRKPNLKSGGVRYIVAPEYPEDYVHTDDANPHVYPEGHALAGQNTIPGFFPFYDFTPVESSLNVPEDTCGIPPISVGMPQFEKIAEYNRLRHESALRHSLRLYQLDPDLKDAKKVEDALRNGEDGFSFTATQAQKDVNGNLRPGIVPIQFTGNTMEIDRQAAREEGDWVKVQGMPPAILQGVGTANTLGQDQQGIAAGERESGALIGYFESLTGDLLAGLRGLMHSCYDDEDFQRLLGEKGAAVMKAWQQGSVDDGDEIEVTFGATAQAQATVEKKQIMEAIGVENAEIEPVTGLPKYDTSQLFEELHRRMGVGEPKLNDGTMQQLQQLAMLGKQVLMAQQAQQQGANGAGGETAPKNGKPSPAGPNPSEGDGPQQGTLTAGAHRGTLETSNAG